MSEIIEHDTFKSLELIAGLFYLLITILKTFFQMLWDRPRDVYNLNRCHDALRYPKVSKDMKNFHGCNNFF